MESDNRPPDRWLECPPYGEVIPSLETEYRFIPLKTPLDNHIDLPPGYTFTPGVFIEQMREKKLDVGLIINLTFTSRYYDFNQIIDDLGIEFKQISCRGHNEAPSEDETNRFINACEAFHNRYPKKIIAVHCTHGFNRTGFMICSFLCRVMDWDICAAIETFAERRYPGIYKQDYIKQLIESYGDTDEPLPVCPSRPEWDAEDGLASDAVQVATAEASGTQNQEFYEGINDVTLVKDKALRDKIYRHCCALCQYKQDGNRISFPGGQPVSLDLNNMTRLRPDRYRVSWKADGNRYMLYIQDSDNMFFLTRNLDMWRISGIRFPKLSDLNQDLTDTFLDGEMVIDMDGEQRIPRFLIYDVICLDGKLVSHENFDKRCWYIREVIVEARRRALRQNLINSEGEPFKLRDKAFYELKHAQKTWKMTVSHEKDGLIFQPRDLPYTGGTCNDIFKWKPPHLNSIDFKIKLSRIQKEGCLPEEIIGLHVSNKIDPMISLKMTRDNVHFREYDGKIVEMSIPDKNWKILRERTDKLTPNSYETAVAVIQSIRRPVTEEILFGHIKKVCDQIGLNRTRPN